ncbi:MAG: type IX secretion system protein PorQ [Bacteroidetes bacterium]|nr:type IX secretion system protein PorQ [Bacteroidota bacterium]
MKKLSNILILVAIWQYSFGQIGGQNIFQSLQLPISPQVAAIGGSGLGFYDHQISTALQNPCFIDSSINKTIHFNTTFYPSGVNFGTLGYGFKTKKAGNFLASIQYVSYGKFDGRDAAGNSTGDFKGGDYAIKVGTGRNIKNFIYGANVKVLFSHLETYNSLALATDLSAGFHNEKKQLTATLNITNLGVQLKKYTEGEREKLPLDISIGFSKKLNKIPFRLNIVAQHLQKWNLAYDDPNAVQGTNIFGEPTKAKNKTVENLFRHLIFGTEIDIKKTVFLRFGYNHDRRKNLEFEAKKGLGGLSAGAGINIKQFAIDYTFARYGPIASANHLGISIHLDQFGLKSSNKTNPNLE